MAWGLKGGGREVEGLWKGGGREERVDDMKAAVEVSGVGRTVGGKGAKVAGRMQMSMAGRGREVFEGQRNKKEAVNSERRRENQKGEGATSGPENYKRPAEREKIKNKRHREEGNATNAKPKGACRKYTSLRCVHETLSFFGGRAQKSAQWQRSEIATAVHIVRSVCARILQK